MEYGSLQEEISQPSSQKKISELGRSIANSKFEI